MIALAMNIVKNAKMMVVEMNHDKSTSNDSSSCEGIEKDGGVDRKQAGGVVGKENPAEEIPNITHDQIIK